MDLDVALKFPAAKRYILALLYGAVRLVAWADGGATWSAPAAHLAGSGADVEALEVDGVAVDPGDYTVDKAAGTVTVDAGVFTSPADPRGHVVFLVLCWRFANFAREVEGKYYDGRLLTAPKLRLAVPEFFGGLGQVGGGNLELANGDGFFDQLTKIHWRECALMLGIEVSR